MKAVLLAGGIIQPEEPLAAYSNYLYKSLIPIHGLPMVQWVLNALVKSKSIDEIFIVGMDEKQNLESSKPLIFLPDQSNLFDNIQFGMQSLINKYPDEVYYVLASGDIPSLTPDMVDWLVSQQQADRYDLYYSVISQKLMESTFPGSNRSYVKFRDIAVCGGDINLLSTRLVSQNNTLWKHLAESRKNAMRQAAFIGIDTLGLVALKAITLEQAVARICKKLKLKAKAIQVPYAEMGMDIDKPQQLNIVASYMQNKHNL